METLEIPTCVECDECGETLTISQDMRTHYPAHFNIRVSPCKRCLAKAIEAIEEELKTTQEQLAEIEDYLLENKKS